MVVVVRENLSSRGIGAEVEGPPGLKGERQGRKGAMHS